MEHRNYFLLIEKYEAQIILNPIQVCSNIIGVLHSCLDTGNVHINVTSHACTYHISSCLVANP